MVDTNPIIDYHECILIIKDSTMNTNNNTYRVYEAPSDVLKQKAVPVPLDMIDSHLTQTVASTMVNTLKLNYPGAVGLSSIQCDQLDDIIVCKLGNEYVVMINAEIVGFSNEKQKSHEGCLSTGKFRGDVERFWECSVEYYDIGGNLQSRTLNGFDATVVQHEIDHQNGILFPTLMNSKNKLKQKKKLSKMGIK